MICKERRKADALYQRCAHDAMVQADLRFLFVQMVGKDRFARDTKG